MKKKKTGFSLIELLFGLVLFSIILTSVVLCLQTSSTTLRFSGRTLPLEITLQSSVDDITRQIRQCQDVTGGGASIQLQCSGGSETLSFSNGGIYFNGILLHGGITSAGFTVTQGEEAKYVAVAVSASNSKPGENPISKTLFSSVCLRNVAQGQPSPPPPQSPAPLPPPPPPVPAPVPHAAPRAAPAAAPPRASAPPRKFPQRHTLPMFPRCGQMGRFGPVLPCP